MKNENEITKNLLEAFENEDLIGRASFFNTSFEENYNGSRLQGELIDYFRHSQINPKKGLKTIPIKRLVSRDITLELVELEETRYAFGVFHDGILSPLTGEYLLLEKEILRLTADFLIHPYLYIHF